LSDWYRLDTREVLTQAESDLEHGLSNEEAAARLGKYGPNELLERGAKTPLQIFFDQFKETMVVILIVAAIISAALGEFTDAIVVLVIVVLNAMLGFRQEYQAEQAMAALKKLAVPTVRVRRGGHVLEVSSRDLVPGDLILLEAGNMAPADARLVESVNLRAQEAALTGESEPVSKEADPIGREKLPLAEQHNMIFMGTVITYGRGQAVVTGTGMNTELGKIANLMQSAGQEPTPLQRRLATLGKQLAVLAFLLVLIMFVLGLLRGEDLRVLLLTSIGLAVAAVPEGLTAVVTIALALGARRMLKRRALIRKLPAVEALGSVTVICSDKTGTLTENRMTVTVLDVADHRLDLNEELSRNKWADVSTPCNDAPSGEQLSSLADHPTLALLLAGGALCNDALLECDESDPNHYRIIGDPTEGALVVSAARMGLKKESLEGYFPRVGEVPFDSDRKRMTTVHALERAGAGELQDDGPVSVFVEQLTRLSSENMPPYLAFTKGATDGLLQVSNRVYVDGRLEPMDAGWRSRIEAANARLAENGMRVLGVALRSLSEPTVNLNGKNPERELIFIGLFGMIDPARPEVKAAVETCKSAGIRPIMITGDHPLTARYIGQELGISQGEEVLTGQDLEHLSPEDLEETAVRVSMYARVSPEHKLKIVDALQRRGEIVAMTGDGVNDAPALREADIGVAMGITGTDVSKEASDMVLLDDNFATIVAAVEEGRVIYDNIRKFIKYTMTSNTAEIWVMLLAPFFGMPLALLPLQILWINLVTDGVPGLALSVEKAERNTMRRKPYPPNENVFARGTARDILIIGFLMGIMSLIVGYIYWLRDPDGIWQTMVFTTLTLSEMGYVMAIRSNRDSLFSIGLFSNRAMIGAVLLTYLLQFAVVYVPFLNRLLDTQPLPLPDLAVTLVLSTSLFFVVEFEKWLLRKFGKEQ
jgi:Ca2+-transporting ATPase